MVQTLVRVYPCRTVVAWCPGGLAGPIDFWSPALFDQIAASTHASRVYCRVAFSREKTAGDAAYLRSRGWVSPSTALSAALTMVWELPSSDDQVLTGLTQNWRHNLNRALKRNLRVTRWTDPSPAVLSRLYEHMAAHKDIDASFDASQLTALFRSLDGLLLMYGCESDAGVPLAVRACVVQHNAAWDLLAATSAEGRRCYASYAVLWALIRECRSLGVTQYDLSGVDPIGARGVYDFKRGTGAREQECLGEWEWSTSPLLRRAVNLMVRNRSRAAFR